MLISTGAVAHLNINVLSRGMSSEASSEPSQKSKWELLVTSKAPELGFECISGVHSDSL